VTIRDACQWELQFLAQSPKDPPRNESTIPPGARMASGAHHTGQVATTRFDTQTVYNANYFIATSQSGGRFSRSMSAIRLLSLVIASPVNRSDLVRNVHGPPDGGGVQNERQLHT
jgi:hypothetical protein